MCGVYLNRARLINTIIFVPLVIILCLVSPLLGALGKSPELIEYSQTYISVNLPGVFFLGLFDLERRFLNCAKSSWAPMIVQAFVTFLHLYWCQIFVAHLEMELVGIGIATSITSFTLFGATVLYGRFGVPEI